jgi:putative endonuclease
MKHYVYIINSLAEPEQFYVGMTDNVETRLLDHNSGKSSHTSKYKPWRMVFYCWFDDVEKAQAFEKYLKSGSGRAFAAKRLR